MPELRRDPIIGRWVIIAKERGRRPTDFIIAEEPVRGGFCPLCEGNEHTTPHEVLAYGRSHFAPDTPGWSLRVVPNKFPALVIEGDLGKEGEGIYDKMNGIGAHEVIIETPRHDDVLHQMPVTQIKLILMSYRDRMLDLMRDMRFRYIIVFKNFKRAAGASLEHSHSQLIALPIVPYLIQEEINSCLRYFDYKERCVFCDIIRQELATGSRIVCENSNFITICPFAPRSPFEMWLLPKRHISTYTDLDDSMLDSLAQIFSETMKRLNAAIPNVPYNYMLHTSPLKQLNIEHYHWHIEIMPKTTMVAGFEWGTGFYINTTPPEEAAKFLREVRLLV